LYDPWGRRIEGIYFSGKPCRDITLQVLFVEQKVQCVVCKERDVAGICEGEFVKVLELSFCLFFKQFAGI